MRCWSLKVSQPFLGTKLVGRQALSMTDPIEIQPPEWDDEDNIGTDLEVPVPEMV